MTRLGYQIPNFTYPGVSDEQLFPTIAAQAVEAEGSGFDTVLVMDHFFQLPMLGPPTNHMLEAYTVLSALAGVTSKVRLGALVTGNTYRNPAILAKTVTALDIVSGGRAQLGIGSGWFELEHDAFGIEFGTFTDRFQKLEEALQIIIPMLRGETVSFSGKYYRVSEAFNLPQPIGSVPVMIGGGGEKKTLRMVAQYADESNLIADAASIPRKLDALASHCDALGRDRSDITVTWQRNTCVAPTTAEAENELDAYMAERGIDVTKFSPEDLAGLRSLIIYGDPDTVGEQLASELATGVDGFTLNAPANGHIPGRVALLGEVASKVVNGV